MTSRPGAGALDQLRYTRSKKLCHLIRIVRRDGVEVAFTDHDRALTFEGVTYIPVVMAELSADRREAALRTGDQEVKGQADGTTVTIPDINSGLYLGATVFQVIADWQKPWIVFARHRRWIRKVVRRGDGFTATLQGRSQQLQRQAAGRFGGTWTTTCPYKLAGEFCRKDISAWTQMAASEIGTGTAANAVSLTDGSKSWTADQWAGYRVLMRAGGVGSGQELAILGNDATTLFVDGQWSVLPVSCAFHIGRGPTVATVIDNRREFTVTAALFTNGFGDDWYRDGEVHWVTGANAGQVCPIGRYEDAAYRFELLLPTLYPIQVGDRGVIRVGCDGLFTTCKDKFANQLNFGGDHEAPSAAQVIEQPGER